MESGLGGSEDLSFSPQQSRSCSGATAGSGRLRVQAATAMVCTFGQASGFSPTWARGWRRTPSCCGRCAWTSRVSRRRCEGLDPLPRCPLALVVGAIERDDRVASTPQRQADQRQHAFVGPDRQTRHSLEAATQWGHTALIQPRELSLPQLLRTGLRRASHEHVVADLLGQAEPLRFVFKRIPERTVGKLPFTKRRH